MFAQRLSHFDFRDDSAVKIKWNPNPQSAVIFTFCPWKKKINSTQEIMHAWSGRNSRSLSLVWQEVKTCFFLPSKGSITPFFVSRCSLYLRCLVPIEKWLTLLFLLALPPVISSKTFLWPVPILSAWAIIFCDRFFAPVGGEGNVGKSVLGETKGQSARENKSGLRVCVL